MLRPIHGMFLGEMSHGFVTHRGEKRLPTPAGSIKTNGTSSKSALSNFYAWAYVLPQAENAAALKLKKSGYGAAVGSSPRFPAARLAPAFRPAPVTLLSPCTFFGSAQVWLRLGRVKKNCVFLRSPLALHFLWLRPSLAAPRESEEKLRFSSLSSRLALSLAPPKFGCASGE